MFASVFIDSTVRNEPIQSLTNFRNGTLAWFQRQVRAPHGRPMDIIQEITSAFEKIYADNHWVFGSGPGSLPRNTVAYRAFLESFLDNNNIRTVTDLGCGDWQFSRLINWSGRQYTGFDVVGALVETNQRCFGAPNISFRMFDAIDALPGGDLLIAKEVLQHLPNAVVQDYIATIRRRYKFALITDSVEPEPFCNTDISAGQCRPLRLQKEPFSIGGAVVLTYYVFDSGTYWKNEVFLTMGDVL
jgi:SAM-dependent methyltransferase